MSQYIVNKKMVRGTFIFFLGCLAIFSGVVIFKFGIVTGIIAIIFFIIIMGVGAGVSLLPVYGVAKFGQTHAGHKFLNNKIVVAILFILVGAALLWRWYSGF